MLDYIGWVATTLFASSYFYKQPAMLRRIQALAAMLWICYGVLIHALPVVVANLIVAGVALYSSFRPPVASLDIGGNDANSPTAPASSSAREIGAGIEGR